VTALWPSSLGQASLTVLALAELPAKSFLLMAQTLLSGLPVAQQMPHRQQLVWFSGMWV
jgi:hypothetical protein